MKNNIIIYIAVLLFCSCAHSEFYSVDSTLTTGAKTSTYMLKGDSLSCFSHSVQKILATNDYLVIIQSCPDTIFKVIDVNTDSIIASFGQIGHSKNEFSHVPFFAYTRNDNEGKTYIYVQEMTNTKIIDLEKSITFGKCVVKDNILEKENALYCRKFYLDSKNIFLYKTVRAKDVREFERELPDFALLHGNKQQKKWNIFPCFVEYDEPFTLATEYGGIVTINPDASKALFAMNMIDVLTIFNLKDYSTIGVVSSDGYTFDRFNNFTKDKVDDEMIIYNMDVCSSEDNIYVLKDCRLYSKMLESEDTSYPSQLWVYDWNGRGIANSMLDRSLIEIEYCQKNKTMYGLTIDRDAIYKYKIK